MAVREAFREWLSQQGLTARTQNTQNTHASRIAGAYGDLDQAYDRDAFASVLAELAYSKEDERSGRPNPARFDIDGDVYSNLAGYRATLAYYGRFRASEAANRLPAPEALSLNQQELERLRARFLTRYPDFPSLTFAADHGAYWNEERAYKEQVSAGARAILAQSGASDQAIGQGLIDLLQTPPANFIGWRAFQQIKGAGPEAERMVAAAIGELVRDKGEVAAIAANCAAKIHPLITGGGLGNAAYGQVRSLVTTALAFARPADAMAVKTRFLQRAAKRLMGRRIFKNAVMSAEEYGQMLALANALLQIMRDDWRWAPRDLWDVQGFLWATSDEANEDDDDEAAGEVAEQNQMTEPRAYAAPTNLILYGPPGTGKTYATAARAVELCDGGLPPGGRPAVMERYKVLVERKRISFVTFHQSYGYEDFVEGLRPETNGADREGETSGSAGFSLKPRPGVFRQIAELARDNRGQAVAAPQLDRTRQAFKMSLGRSGQEEGARVFQAAFDGEFVSLGWGGEIDWSATQFEDFAAIKARWLQDHPQATGYDPNVVQMYAFRGNMQVGDLVIVPDGNRRFRAIGEVTGPYYFLPDAPDGFGHRRPVRWLWRNDDGRERELIYHREFRPTSVYQLDSSQLDWPALEQLVAGGGTASAVTGEPEPYVLIIDEINRANVSKVFGELITLIEPDKRLGGANALTVTLPYSGDSFGVPSNLHIVATMNTADRSIALLDTALRRRFEFEELTPNPSALDEASAATGIDLMAVLSGLNSRIEYLFDRDHQIGHAFFISCQSLADLTRVMRGKVIPLLAEYFYENWEKVRQVLGESEDAGQFVSRVKLESPKGSDVFAFDEGRWRYQVQSDFPASAYDQLKA